MCEYVYQDYVSDLRNAKIYFNGNYDNLTFVMNSKLSSNSSVQLCPPQRPFYDATVNECISCSDD